MNPRIQAEFRLEELTSQNNATGSVKGGRVWIDITVDGVKAQSQVWFSGPRNIAEKICSGELMINSKAEVVDGPNARVEGDDASGPTEFEVFTGQRNPTVHW